MNTGEVKDYRHNWCPGRMATNELKKKDIIQENFQKKSKD